MRLLLALLILSLSSGITRAHIGSPDVFFEGKIGAYPAAITIRMPAVVPGRAQIEVRSPSDRALQVSILPLYSRTAVKNSPPADAALPVPGESGVYRGELWLMRAGAYSVEVSLRGDAGEGVVQIPINSEPLHQLPLPPYLAAMLLVLGSSLVVGGLAIVRAAATEATLPPGATLDPSDRRKGLKAGAVAAVVFAGLLAGGLYWWNVEEAHFRRQLRKGVWPDLVADVRTEGADRVLRLTLGEKDFPPHRAIPLLTDHGKLLHTFLVGGPGGGCIAHLHPVRADGKVFEVTMPPLPEGDYRVFVDLVLADSGASTTTATTIHLPAIPSAEAAHRGPKIDADDSWAPCPPASVPSDTDPAPIYRFDDGLQLAWKTHPPLRARHDACLQFEVRDTAGQPVPLEPYMGMISHAAVMRADGSVFAHLHPAGNFSMAAQSFFETKVTKEAASAGGQGGAPAAPEMDHSKMHHGTASGGASFSLPYEFPSSGEYQIWVQFKTGGQVRTAHFIVTVLPE
jgi:hypothetical protein